MSLEGHLWTVRPWLAHRLRPRKPPPSIAWSTSVQDPTLGLVRLRGRLTQRPGARSLVVLVHGLGGDSSSYYVLAAANAAEQAGLSSLRLDLRGADGEGHDFYNAGLTADLRAAIGSEALAGHDTILVLGFSLGGHLTLRYATEAALDPRVRAVAAVCPPIDLDRTAEAIDQPRAWVYRRHVLDSLKQLYAAVSAHRARRGTPGRPPPAARRRSGIIASAPGTSRRAGAALRLPQRRALLRRDERRPAPAPPRRPLAAPGIARRSHGPEPRSAPRSIRRVPAPRRALAPRGRACRLPAVDRPRDRRRAGTLPAAPRAGCARPRRSDIPRRYPAGRRSPP